MYVGNTNSLSCSLSYFHIYINYKSKVILRPPITTEVIEGIGNTKSSAIFE